MSENKTCILLMNMGGPATLDDVEPFLYNLFMDPDIIEIPLGRLLRPFIAKKISKKRSAKVRGYYEKIGGGSPLLRLTENQAAALENTLSSSGNFKTFVAMRYSPPFTEEAIRKIVLEEPFRIVLLPLYPQYSGTTSGSSFNEFY
ncbi:ferrochelatase, partial [Candidatus Pacearchaeota archaeon]|nr:ferrochelatase [Candidatus Pacearchaeota archaeon]